MNSNIPNFLDRLIDEKSDTSIRVKLDLKLLNEMCKSIPNKNKFYKENGLEKRTSIRYFNSEREIPISVLRKVAKEYSKQTRQKFDLVWKNVYNNIKHFKSESSASKPINIPTKLTQELVYLVGALRDGCLATYSGNKNYFGVVFVQESSLKWLEKILIPYLKKVFGITVGLKPNLQIYNKPLFRFFERVFEHPPGEQENWNTPKLIRNAPIKLKSAYIRGFFDAEGTVILTDPKIGFFQKNKESLEFIKRTLESLGIKSGKISWDRRVWRFWIAEKNSINLFAQKVGSLHPEKGLRLRKLVKLIYSQP